MISDPLAGLRAYLLSVSDVTDLCGQRIYVAEAPEETAAEKQAMVTLTATGGVGPGSRSYLKLGSTRVDVKCYGAVEMGGDGTLGIASAGALHLAVHGALKNLDRSVQGSVLLHDLTQETGPSQLRDPDTRVPFVLSIWNLVAGEAPVSA